EVFQFLAGFEVGDLLRRHFHFRTRLRISSRATATLPGAEAAETADLDFVVRLESSDDALENGLDHRLGLFSRQLRDPRDLFDEVRLGHRVIFIFTLSRNFFHRLRASSPDLNHHLMWAIALGACAARILGYHQLTAG